MRNFIAVTHYQTPNRVDFVTLRTQRNRRAIRAEKIQKAKNIVLTVLAITFFVLALGYVGEQDRQTEMLEAGYTLQEAQAK